MPDLRTGVVGRGSSVARVVVAFAVISLDVAMGVAATTSTTPLSAAEELGVVVVVSGAEV